MMTMLNEDDVACCNLPTGRVNQQGTTVLLHVSTCIQGQQAWSQFALPSWASAADGGAEWCGHTSVKKTPAGQPSSSLTWAASAGIAGFWQGWHCRGPAMSGQAMLLVTGTRVWRQTGGRCAAVAEQWSSQKRSSSHVTSLIRQHWYRYRGHGRRWIMFLGELILSWHRQPVSETSSSCAPC